MLAQLLKLEIVLYQDPSLITTPGQIKDRAHVLMLSLNRLGGQYPSGNTMTGRTPDACAALNNLEHMKASSML